MLIATALSLEILELKRTSKTRSSVEGLRGIFERKEEPSNLMIDRQRARGLKDRTDEEEWTVRQ